MSDGSIKSTRCIVHGCTNHTNEGTFISFLCAPCYQYITTGIVGHTDSFLRRCISEKKLEEMQRHANELKTFFREL